MNPIQERKNPKPDQCANLGCTNKSQGRKFCSSCRKKQSRSKDPIKYAYDTLRDNARRRGKEFGITIEEFRKFCIQTEYHLKKGKTTGGFTVDRIDNEKGYTLDNIQCIETTENIKKYYKYDWYSRKAIEEIKLPQPPPEDLPF